LQGRVYRGGAAARFISERLARGEVAFSLEELERKTGLSRIAARHQLLRLGKRVRRVAPRQPFFLIVTEEHQPMGAPPAVWWLDAYFRWLGRPYYLALASAAAEYGAAPQGIQLVQVITDQPRRPLVLGRILVRFYVKHEAGRTPTSELPGAHAPLRVSTSEATAIDLVRYAAALGGMERAVETLKPLAVRLRKAALKEALAAEGEAATAQRLGFILDGLGYHGLAETVERSLPARLAPVRLDSGAKGHERELRLHRRWGLLVGERPLGP
jgi:hypothetical protein